MLFPLLALPRVGGARVPQGRPESHRAGGGREVAELVPLSAERRAMLHLAGDGTVRWNGQKPRPAPPVGYDGPALSDAVLEDPGDPLL